jgi:predicted SAM-dependent methyltransferase
VTKKKFFNYKNKSIPSWLIEIFLTLRALFFIGKKYTCPVCGWRLRAFTRGGFSFKRRHLGYCPRCHAKARHRRIWLFLKQKTILFTDNLRLLHVSPHYSLSRKLTTLKNIDYIGVDIAHRQNISAKMDITDMPIHTDSFDAIICVHVLEEIIEDRKALREFFRILKPGGWAMISVPTSLDQKTYEDPAITKPEEREKAFGEVDHVRIYGYDFIDRIKECGFQVHIDLNKDVKQDIIEKYALRNDENIFLCKKTNLG